MNKYFLYFYSFLLKVLEYQNYTFNYVALKYIYIFTYISYYKIGMKSNGTEV
jgi:hypothetical protein